MLGAQIFALGRRVPPPSAQRLGKKFRFPFGEDHRFNHPATAQRTRIRMGGKVVLRRAAADHAFVGFDRVDVFKHAKAAAGAQVFGELRVGLSERTREPPEIMRRRGRFGRRDVKDAKFAEEATGA